MHPILLFPILINPVLGSIQFTIASGECPKSGNGVFNPCDDSDAGGLCASASDLDRTWCCRPPKAFCGSWGQTCTGTGNFAGKGQILCQGSDNSKWCCNAEYENCITDAGAINLCMTNFASPYANISIPEALALKSSFFATVSITPSLPTPSPSSSAPQTSSASQSSSQTKTKLGTTETSISSQVPSETSNTPPATDPTPKPPLSHSAIAGISISAILLLVFIAGGSFFLGRKRKSLKGNGNVVLRLGSNDSLAGRTEMEALERRGELAGDDGAGIGRGGGGGGGGGGGAGRGVGSEMADTSRRGVTELA